MLNIKVYKGRDLIFPSGNELGNFSEELYIAEWMDESGRRVAHGRTPEEAKMKAIQRANNDCTI